MKKPITKLLTGALMTGLMAGGTAWADHHQAPAAASGEASGEQHGKKDPKKADAKKKKAKGDKNACGGKDSCGKNGCGSKDGCAGKEKKAEEKKKSTTDMRLPGFPNLGTGVGLRPAYYDLFLGQADRTPRGVSWVEAITENYIRWEDGSWGRPVQILEKVRENYSVVLHGVSLSLGSTDPMNLSHLNRIKELAQRVQPLWISDHLCWNTFKGQNYHDLFPLPFTHEALNWVVDRIKKAQDILGRRILVENVSSYLTYKHSEMTEWDFLAQVAERADCGILLDVNNVYANSVNHGFSALDYLKSVPIDRVGQMHLAGHRNRNGLLIDTHDQRVCEQVWELYRFASKWFPNVSAMIEWDQNLPKWETLESEVLKLKSITEGVYAESRISQPITAAI